MLSGNYVQGMVKVIKAQTGNYMDISQNLERIAVVNLDAGVEKNGEQIYYASKIIEYPNNNYQTTSLEEAKKGLENKQYGAYVIIPSSFSASVDSINQTPEKSVFEYKISSELSEEKREDMIYEIADFEKSTSSNLSYIFVDAILKEIHSVQDGAGTIIGNDSSEKNALLNVRAEALIEPVEFTELRENNEVVKPVDLRAENENLESSVRNIENDFNQALDNGQNDYQEIVTNNQKLEEALERLEKSVEKTDPLLDVNGNYNLTSGIQSVNNLIDEKNQLITAQRDNLKSSIAEEMEFYMQAQENGKLTAQKNTIQTGIRQDVVSQLQSALNKQLDTINLKNEASIQEQNKAIQEKVNNYLVNLQGSVYKNMDSDTTQTILKNMIKNSLTENKSELITYGSNCEKKVNLESYNQMVESDNKTIQELKSAAEDVKNETVGTTDYQTKVDELIEKIEGLEEKEAEEISEELKNLEEPDVNQNVDNSSIDVSSIKELLDFEDAKNSEGSVLEIPTVDVSLQGTSVALSQNDITYEVPDIILEQPTVRTSSLLNIENYYRIPKDGLEDAFEENIVNVIENRNREIQQDIFDKIGEFSMQQKTYQYGLDSFDPYRHMDYNDISNQLTKVSNNIGDIEIDMNDRNEEYLKYTADVYELANEHTSVLQNDIMKANEQTKQKVIGQIDGLKSSRSENNKINTSILQGITKKLTFTRMGDLPYQEAYDFIINPLEYQEADK